MSKFKKFLVYTSFVLAVCVLSYSLIPSVKAYVYGVKTYAAKYVKTATVELEENVTTVVSFATSSPSSTYGKGIQLVDLSNVNEFPHPYSGELRISQIEIGWEGRDAATTTLMFGTVASTSPSGAVVDVNYFETVSFSSGSINYGYNPYQRTVLDYSPSAIKLGNKDSATARALGVGHNATTTGFLTDTTMRDLATSIFATTSTAAISPLGANINYFGVGDLVVKLSRQDGLATTTIRTTYHTQ